MLERDFLMRMIAQSAKALGVIMGLREQKKPDEALVLVDDYLSRELRLKSRIAMGLSDDNLLKMLSVGDVVNGESVAVLSAFLQEEAELLSDLGRTEASVPRFEKALRLNLFLLKQNADPDNWDTRPRVDRLLASLDGYDWEPETYRAVMDWHEREGRYAEAENTLFELQNVSVASNEDGTSFYQRLALLTDEELEAGGLSRFELESGLREWNSLLKGS
ncbi:DUF6483 family protein [Cohnella faecalis]|uniref:Tetratricopeptide repeat protein n=1 Tax=Cohnella faecalis TaxID=2315694 RepID=A0A398CUG9_9BACL|nr:DUF6483 family protein [Cohnella faecalis]RIE02634.1 hypothetical protein D3H35_18305 [Cohnella faecalis]